MSINYHFPLHFQLVGIKLDRPLCFIDAETTGTDPQADRIVTLALATVYPNEDCNQQNTIRDLFELNPGVEMTPENIAIHGITNEMVKDWEPFEKRAGYIFERIKDSDLAGYNLMGLDVPILHQSFYRCGIDWDLEGVRMVDACTIFKRKNPRDLSAAIKRYCSGREHVEAHDAMADAVETAFVLRGQLLEHNDLPPSVQGLHDYCAVDDRDGSRRLDLAGTIRMRKDGVAVFGTKRNRGVPVANDIGYAEWILRSDFPAHTKQVLNKVIDDINDELNPTTDETGELF